MELDLKVTEEENNSIIVAIRELNKMRHLKYMSLSMLSTISSIKVTKVRVILQGLIEANRVVQYFATENTKLARYYYVLIDEVDETDTADENTVPAEDTVSDESNVPIKGSVPDETVIDSSTTKIRPKLTIQK